MAKAKKSVKSVQKTVQKSKKSPAKKAAPMKPMKKTASKVVKKTTTKAAAKKTVKKSVQKSAPKAKSKAKVVAKAPTPKKATAQPGKKTIAPKAASIKRPLVAAKPAPSNIDYSKVVTPLGDRLVVRVIEGERLTAGGLIIPDSVNTATGHIKGKVLAVGQGAKNKKGQVRPLDVKKGDEVLFAQYAGTKVQFGPEELQIVHESDVLGII